MGSLLLAVLCASPGVTFDEAIALADVMPRVEAARRADAVKRHGDADVSSMTLNPQLTVQPGQRFDATGTRNPDLVVEVAQGWNLSGHSGARRDTIVIEEEVLTAEARAVALFERLQVGRVWIDAWQAGRERSVADEERDLARVLEGLVVRLSELGEATAADVEEARAYGAEARLAFIEADGRVFERGIALSRALGRSPAAITDVQGELPKPLLPDLSRPEVLVARIDALPAVKRVALEARVARAREVEEKALRGVVAQLGLVGTRDSSTSGVIVSGVARVSAPLFDRGERERAAMLASAARGDGDVLDARLAAAAELRTAIHEVEHTDGILLELEQRLVPAALNAARLRETLMRAGEATLIETLIARRTAIVAQRRLEAARAAHAWARVRLWLFLSAMVDA